MSVSAVQQSESAIHIHISPLFWTSSHLGHHRALSRVPCALQYVPTICFTHSSIYMLIPISQFIPSSPMATCPFSTSVSLFLPWKWAHLYHFSRFHIYMLKYSICLSLSDWLHSVCILKLSAWKWFMTLLVIVLGSRQITQFLLI